MDHGGQTQLMEIRHFLKKHHAEIAPWSSSARAVDALYQLLREKKSDDSFWKELKTLSTRLEGHYFTPRVATSCDVLASATTNRLIDDLRREINEAKPSGGLRQWLRSPIVSTALAGFLLLGCVEEGGVNDEVEDQIEDEENILSELLDIVKEVDIWESAKDDLLACLPELDAEYRKQLLEAFETMSDDEIVHSLNSMTEWDQICYDDDDIGGH